MCCILFLVPELAFIWRLFSEGKIYCYASFGTILNQNYLKESVFQWETDVSVPTGEIQWKRT